MQKIRQFGKALTTLLFSLLIATQSILASVPSNISGHSFWLQANPPQVLEAWGANNCGGTVDHMCLQAFAHSKTMDTLAGMVELGIDFILGIGDAKGFMECGADISWAICLGAVAGLVPLLGDGAKIALKHGDEVFEVVADNSGGLRLLDDGINATRPDLPDGHNWVADADGNVGILKPDGTVARDVGEIDGIVRGGPNYTPAVIDGRPYSSHALRRMDERGLTPSVIENTIDDAYLVGRVNRPETLVYYDPVNRVQVVTNYNGNVVTVIPGNPPKPGALAPLGD